MYSEILKAIELAWKMATGRAPKKRTEIRISNGDYSYFHIPRGDGNDYPKSGISHALFRIELTMRFPANTTIQAADLYFLPPTLDSTMETVPLDCGARIHSKGPALGTELEKFVANNSEFAPTDFVADKSKRILLAFYGMVSDDRLHKTHAYAHFVLVIQAEMTSILILCALSSSWTADAYMHYKPIATREFSKDDVLPFVLKRVSVSETMEHKESGVPSGDKKWCNSISLKTSL